MDLSRRSLTARIHVFQSMETSKCVNLTLLYIKDNKSNIMMIIKSSNINLEISRQVSREIIEFALLHNVKVIVIENLAGWKAKAGKKGTLMRQVNPHLNQRL